MRSTTTVSKIENGEFEPDFPWRWQNSPLGVLFGLDRLCEQSVSAESSQDAGPAVTGRCRWTVLSRKACEGSELRLAAPSQQNLSQI